MGQPEKKASKGVKDISHKIYRVMVEGASESGDSGLFHEPKLHVGTVSGNKEQVKAQAQERLKGTAEGLGGNVLVQKNSDGSISLVENANKVRTKGSTSTLKPTINPADVLDELALQRFKSGKSEKQYVKAKTMEGVEFLPPTPKALLEQNQGGSVRIEEIAKRTLLPDFMNRALEQPETPNWLRYSLGAWGDTNPQNQSGAVVRGLKTFGPATLTGFIANEGIQKAIGNTPEAQQAELNKKKEEENRALIGKASIVRNMPHTDWNAPSVANKAASMAEDFGLDQKTLIKAMGSVYSESGSNENFFSYSPDVILDEIKNRYVSLYPEMQKEAELDKRKINKGDIRAYIKAVQEGKVPFFFPPQIMGEKEVGPSGESIYRMGRKSPDNDGRRYVPIIVSSGADSQKELGKSLQIPTRTSLVWVDTSKAGIEGITEENMALSKVNREAKKKK